MFANNLGVPLELAVIFAAVVVITFAATTMDTGVRLQRYVVQEIAELAGWHKLARNLTLAGLVAVAVPLAMALLPGGGERRLHLRRAVAAVRHDQPAHRGARAVGRRGVGDPERPQPRSRSLVPLVFLLPMTTWALIVNLRNFVEDGQWVLAPLDAIIFVLAMWLVVEAVIALRKAGGRRTPTDDPTGPVDDDSRAPSSR